MTTTNQTITKGSEYVEVTDAVASGLFSVVANIEFATGLTQPPKSLIGHLLDFSEPRRYSLAGGLKLWVKANPTEDYIVVVDED